MVYDRAKMEHCKTKDLTILRGVGKNGRCSAQQDNNEHDGNIYDKNGITKKALPTQIGSAFFLFLSI